MLKSVGLLVLVIAVCLSPLALALLPKPPCGQFRVVVHDIATHSWILLPDNYSKSEATARAEHFFEAAGIDDAKVVTQSEAESLATVPRRLPN